MKAEEFYSKIMALNDGEFLEASFGQAVYKAFKEDGKCVIAQVKWRMYKSTERMTASSADGFEYQLTECEKCQKWYAVNQFTGKIQFLDNWTTFLKSFKYLQS